MADTFALDVSDPPHQAQRPVVEAHHVLPRVHEAASGTAHSVPSMCAALQKLGVRPTLHTMRTAEGAQFPFPVRVYPALAGMERIGLAPAMRRALGQIDGSQSLIHNSSLWMLPNVYAGLGAREAGVPLIVSPRGTLSTWSLARSRMKKKVAWWGLGQKRALDATTAFHATADAEVEDIRRMGYRQPIALITNGFAPVPPPSEEDRASRAVRRLLYFGRIHSKKGVLELVQSWHRLAADFPGWELVIAGKDDEPGYAEQVREAAAAAPRCAVQGPAYGDDKTALYGSADVLVLHTHNENFGLVVPEALSAEVPCVVSKGAPWSGLEDHRCGWWIDRTDAALDGALRAAMALPEAERRAMGRRGRAWADDAFSWDQVALKMRGVYDWVLGIGDRPDCVITD